MTKTSIGELTDDQLKQCDIVIVIDHSGSMSTPSKRFKSKNRIEEVQEDVLAVARIAEKFDNDGLTVIGFSSAVQVYDGVTSEKVANVFKEFGPRGSTNLAAALQAAAQKATESAKPSTVVLVYTDGEPDDQSEVIQVIKTAAMKLGRPKVGFTLVQVGDDPAAQRFLEYLDDSLEKQGVPDVVATIPEVQAETLSVQQLAWLALNS
jgi:Mg-chelatase subunit ChlD